MESKLDQGTSHCFHGDLNSSVGVTLRDKLTNTQIINGHEFNTSLAELYLIILHCSINFTIGPCKETQITKL